jgi:hypothetical protein
MDGQSMYGTFSTLPADAVGKCPLTNCTTPSTLFRGQQFASVFAQDSTAIYWTTPAIANLGFAVWKAAK